VAVVEDWSEYVGLSRLMVMQCAIVAGEAGCILRAMPKDRNLHQYVLLKRLVNQCDFIFILRL
jgi:hypothetical protein